MKHICVKKVLLPGLCILFGVMVLGLGAVANIHVLAAEFDATPTPLPQGAPGVLEMKATRVEGEPTSFLVKWKTVVPVKGWIEYGTSVGNLDKVAYDVRGEDMVDTTHWVLVKDAQPDTEYFFASVADGKRYDNGGTPFQVRMPALDEVEAVAEPVSASESGTEPNAEPTPSPEAMLEMKATAVEDGTGGFLVKWKTVVPVKGWIEYGTSADNLHQVAYDVRGEDVVDTTHWVLVKDAQPDTEYFFASVADGKKYDSNGIPFQMRMPALDEVEVVAEPVSASESGAEPNAEPTPSPEAMLEMKATAVEDGTGGFLVKWKTVVPVKGWIEYGTSADNLDKVAYDIRGENVVDTTHQVVVGGMKLNMAYYFVISVGGRRYDNNGSPFQLMTKAAVWLPYVSR